MTGIVYLHVERILQGTTRCRASMSIWMSSSPSLVACGSTVRSSTLQISALRDFFDRRPSKALDPVFPQPTKKATIRLDKSSELRIGVCLMSRRAFVTVGSTKFPELVRAVLASATITLLAELGFDELCVQYGTDKQLFVEETRQQSETILITGFDYSPSIEQEMENADLIISHAGTMRCLAHIDV